MNDIMKDDKKEAAPTRKKAKIVRPTAPQTDSNPSSNPTKEAPKP
jgi:hypothetical protein